MAIFIGTYECKADAKGRIALPGALKEALKWAVSETFVIKRSVFNPCLEMYPMKEWERMTAHINGLNRFVKKNNDFIRLFMAGVRTVETDTAGRILIPKNLCEFSGIEKEVVLSPLGDVFEIWDKARYELAIANATPDFSALAEEVMGNKKQDEPLS